MKWIRRMGLVAGLALAASAGVIASSAGPQGRAAARPPATQAARARPNVVFILTDDLSWNLVNSRFAPHIVALERRGATFNHYFVADSLCCPSRSSIFTGQFPHNTKVVANTGQNGGYRKFQSEHLFDRTYALALQRGGYRTSMLGKYLNGYGDPSLDANTSSGQMPPGWSDWHVSNSSGYAEYNYLLSDNGKVDAYGGPLAGGGPSGAADAYGVDVVGAYAQRFIMGSRGRPFILEAATFAPHQPFTPARRNANDFPGLTEPRDPSFNAQNVNPPNWLGQRKPIGPKQLANLDAAYRKRAQSVEAVDQLLAGVERTLAARNLTRNTVHRVQLRQRLPHRPTPSDPRQADRIRHRHPGPADRRRPRRAARPDRHRRWRRTSTCTRRSWPSPACGRARFGRRSQPPATAPSRPSGARLADVGARRAQPLGRSERSRLRGRQHRRQSRPPTRRSGSPPAICRASGTGRGGVRRVPGPATRDRVLRPPPRPVRDRQHRRRT